MHKRSQRNEQEKNSAVEYYKCNSRGQEMELLHLSWPPLYRQLLVGFVRHDICVGSESVSTKSFSLSPFSKDPRTKEPGGVQIEKHKSLKQKL